VELKTDDYLINYDAETGEIRCTGSLLLSGTEEYTPILDLMLQAANEQNEHLTLNVTELEFLNSSGINTMTKFVINVRKKKTVQLTAIGLDNTPWQTRLLKNLKRLMPSLEIQMQ